MSGMEKCERCGLWFVPEELFNGLCADCRKGNVQQVWRCNDTGRLYARINKGTLTGNDDNLVMARLLVEVCKRLDDINNELGQLTPPH